MVNDKLRKKYKLIKTKRDTYAYISETHLVPSAI